MKKLMASAIIILPLLLLAILLVSGAILSLVTHIYVEDVEFAKKDAIVLLMDNEENPQTRNIMDEVNVFPISAKNRDLIFSSSNENVATVNEEGIVTPVFYGETYITVQSRENLAAVAKRKLIVTGTTIHSFIKNDYPADMFVGESAQLSVSVYPIDALNKAQKWESDSPDILKVNANGTVTAIGEGQAKITVTAVGNEQISQTFTINCHRQAQENFKIYCAGKELQNGKTYKTFLNQLTFYTYYKPDLVQYKTNNDGAWQSLEDGVLTVDTTNVDNITFKCDGETVSFTLEKVLFDNFDLDIFATLDTDDGAKTMILDTAYQANKKDELSLMLAKNVQDCFTLSVKLDEDIVGGFGDETNFEKMIDIDLLDAEGYEVCYDSLTNQIIISFAGMNDFQQDIALKLADKTISLKLRRVAVSGVEFTNEKESFDSQNTVDIYKGYQQVSVYAKHSYYDGKQVDYFKIPFKVFTGSDRQTQASPDAVNWKMTRYVGNESEGVLTSQFGSVVTFGEKKYKIVQEGEEYVLKDAQNLEGEAISGKDGKNENGVIWVDAFSEPGYARIYFGTFAGLTESDVYNDYFGAFDDKSWKMPEKTTDNKNGGVIVEPSKNAFAFLRIDAGDGTVGGVNCHFNFNVLEDDQLFNVFDAEGYYNNDNIVLQTNLYGSGELGNSGKEFDNATKEGLFLTEASDLGKTIIYGNGYQVNFQAKNAAMEKYSESDGITVKKAYNAVIKCANPVENISKDNQKMVLKMDYAYYCNLSYYYKFNPVGNAFYTKNTVFSSASKTGIQLTSSGQSLYAENIVMVECGTSILVDMDQNVNIYFKGFVDILCYANKTTLNNFNSWVEMVYGLAVPNVGPYFEWHGLNQTSSINNKQIDNFYVNVLIFSVSDLNGKVFVWEGNDYKNASDGAMLENGSKIKNKLLMKTIIGSFYAWTYEILNDEGARLDNATVEASETNLTGKADIDSFFTENRYIRLLCEYKAPGVKNFDHILWHMQNTYRDTSLLDGRINNHIENLKESLIVSKDDAGNEHRTGIQWQDGSGIDENGIPYSATESVDGNTTYVDGLQKRRYASELLMSVNI